VFLTEGALTWLEGERVRVAFETIASASVGCAVRRRFRTSLRRIVRLQALARGASARREVGRWRAEQRRAYLEEVAAAAEAEVMEEMAAVFLQRWWRDQIAAQKAFEWQQLAISRTSISSWGDDGDLPAASEDQPSLSYERSFVFRWKADQSLERSRHSVGSDLSASTILAMSGVHRPSTGSHSASARSDGIDIDIASSRGNVLQDVAEIPSEDFALHQYYHEECMCLVAQRDFLSARLPSEQQALLDDLDFALELLGRGSPRIKDEHVAFIRETTRQLQSVLDAEVEARRRLTVTSRCKDSAPATAIVATACQGTEVVFHNNHPRVLQKRDIPSAPRLRPQASCADLRQKVLEKRRPDLMQKSSSAQCIGQQFIDTSSAVRSWVPPPPPIGTQEPWAAVVTPQSTFRRSGGPGSYPALQQSGSTFTAGGESYHPPRQLRSSHSHSGLPQQFEGTFTPRVDSYHQSRLSGVSSYSTLPQSESYRPAQRSHSYSTLPQAVVTQAYPVQTGPATPAFPSQQSSVACTSWQPLVATAVQTASATPAYPSQLPSVACQSWQPLVATAVPTSSATQAYPSQQPSVAFSSWQPPVATVAAAVATAAALQAPVATVAKASCEQSGMLLHGLPTPCRRQAHVQQQTPRLQKRTTTPAAPVTARARSPPCSGVATATLSWQPPHWAHAAPAIVATPVATAAAR